VTVFCCNACWIIWYQIPFNIPKKTASLLNAALGHTVSVSSKPIGGAAVWLELGVAAVQGKTKKDSAAPSAENETMIALVEDDPDVYFATSESLTDWNTKCLAARRPTRRLATVQQMPVAGALIWYYQTSNCPMRKRRSM